MKSSAVNGNVIVLILSFYLYTTPTTSSSRITKSAAIAASTTKTFAHTLTQSDYGASIVSSSSGGGGGGSSSAEDMIDPLTALAPFASLDIYHEDAEILSDTDTVNRQNQVTEDAQHAQHQPQQKPSTVSNSTSTASNSAENDGRAVAGTLLEEFAGGKMNTAEASNMLPIFLTEPESVFVVKNRPAVLKCKAAHALQLQFKCSGSSQPPPSTHDKHVDPHTGVHVEEVTATIHRDLVDEYFGKGPFKCECQAWSSRGVAKSQAATVHIAYIRKSFAQSPTSLRVEVGSRADLHCEPPGGFPEPKLVWYKNNVPIVPENELAISINGGKLSFRQVALQDMANYTCSAENIAGKRVSDSAVVIVYVNGAWSPWSPWRECKCAGKPSFGRKRSRTCSNPLPLNGGSQCSGPQVQKSPDCAPCPEDTQIVNADGFDISSSKRIGRWSAWSEWSICSMECIQVRRRRCLTGQQTTDISVDIEEVAFGGSIIGANSAAHSGISGGVSSSSSIGFGMSSIGAGSGYGKSLCAGKDTQTAECRGELCQIGKDDFDWTLYLGLAFIAAVCFSFGAALICCARRSIRANPHYNMARTVMDAEYLPGADKKDMRMHMEAANMGYDYVNPGHRYLPGEHIVSCGVAEHHYDVPNLAANYTNPIDELSGEYLTDTGDSSTADTSNSTFDMTAKLSLLSASKCTTYELISSAGGQLRLYGGDLTLFIPELAVGRHAKKHVSLVLLSDESSRILMPSTPETSLVCSTVVHCAPRSYSFVKPVVLKIPHCLADPEQWHVHIYHADSDYDDLNVNWRKVVTVGEETINTPVFVQLEPTHVYIMTEQLGHFAVVADAKFGGAFTEPAIKMKLIAFSQLTPTSGGHSSLRIYVVKDFANSKDICTNIESKLGGTFMGESTPFGFYLNSSNLYIRVRGTWEDQHYEHMIPYNHILNNNSILHCEFSIRRYEATGEQLEVDFAQCEEEFNDSVEYHSFSIPKQAPSGTDGSSVDPRQTTTVSLDRQGNYVNDASAVNGIAQLPLPTKRLICAALDPPRADERDWRLLAKKLNTDRYIAYFATKPSPTEQILNLWECRTCSATPTNPPAIVELLQTLKDMGRQDVLDIIVETIGPLWL